MGDLVEHFGPASFAILFVTLMALPALPLPTGLVSHGLELVTLLLAGELVVGRTQVWLPRRWHDHHLKRASGPKFTAALVKRVRWVERFSRPRLAALLDRRASDVAFGAAVAVLTVTAFVAPPFSGLDTLPALGVVVLSLGMLLRDAVVVAAGLAIGVLGVGLVVALGGAALRFL